VEGVFGYGRASPLHRPSPRRRGYERSLPRIRHFPQTGYKILSRYKAEGVSAISQTGHVARGAMPTSCRRNAKPSSSAAGRTSPTGVPVSSANCWSADCPAKSKSPRSAPSTPCSTATVSFGTKAARAAVPWVLRFPPALPPTTSGASISRASSGLAMANTATRSPSPTTPRATCCFARRSIQPARIRPSRGYCRGSDLRIRSTACVTSRGQRFRRHHAAAHLDRRENHEPTRATNQHREIQRGA
jgi:hypothetical protein